jgi:uncharacterized membrane protein (GlpM family)
MPSITAETHISFSLICSLWSVACNPASVLALKMAFAATIVVVASVAVERSGAFIGALIAALPTAASAAYIILGLEHSASFVSASAIGSLAANAAVAIFALAYAVLAQRHGLLFSLTIALLVWFCAAAALRTIEWSALGALALNAIVYSATTALSARYRRSSPVLAIARRRYDLLIRAFTAAVVVAAVTTASHRIGSFASGVFAVFPVVMSSLAVVLHPRVGGKASAAVFAHAQLPLFGLALGFFVVHHLAQPAGVWWAYMAGVTVSAGWSGILWLMRIRRVKRSFRNPECELN